MADLSWISALTNQGGGGGSSGGVSDYDQLKNRPVTNIAGTGTVISALETGVYNIEVLQTKVNRKNEKSPAKFTRPKMGITKQAGEKSHRQPG